MMQRRRRLPPPPLMRLHFSRQRLLLIVLPALCHHQHFPAADAASGNTAGFCCHHHHYGTLRLDLFPTTTTTTGIPSSSSSSSIRLFSQRKQHQQDENFDDTGEFQHVSGCTNDDDDNNDEFRRGVGVLLTVPVAWGSYEPAVRLVYKIQPHIPPFLFSFVYYLVATTALSTVSSVLLQKQEKQQEMGDGQDIVDEIDPTTRDIIDRGGFELGTYLFVGNALQVIGLSEVASDRAAFELQLTTILVPIVQSVLAKNLRLIDFRTWIACLIALGGVGLIGLDGGGGSTSSSNTESTTSLLSDPASMLSNVSFSNGDFFIMLGALFYSFHCVRLEVYAQNTPPVQLASAKAKTETGWSALILGTCALAAALAGGSGVSLSMMKESPFGSIFELARSSGDNVLTYIEGIDIQQDNIDDWVKVGAATVWTGLVTVAYTIAAQSYGQARVPATTANLIYTIQPFFTALIAYIVLGESLGVFGYAGGVTILAAVLLVILPPNQESDDKFDKKDDL